MTTQQYTKECRSGLFVTGKVTSFRDISLGGAQKQCPASSSGGTPKWATKSQERLGKIHYPMRLKRSDLMYVMFNEETGNGLQLFQKFAYVSNFLRYQVI